MSILLFLAVQSVPVPPVIRPAKANHKFSCTTFTAKGERQRISGESRARAKGLWDSDLTLSSADPGKLPVGSFRASSEALQSLSFKAKGKDGEEYTYMFERSFKLDKRPANGRVIISVQRWPAPSTFFATGICNFESELAG